MTPRAPFRKDMYLIDYEIDTEDELNDINGDDISGEDVEEESEQFATELFEEGFVVADD